MSAAQGDSFHQHFEETDRNPCTCVKSWDSYTYYRCEYSPGPEGDAVVAVCIPPSCKLTPLLHYIGGALALADEQIVMIDNTVGQIPQWHREG